MEEIKFKKGLYEQVISEGTEEQLNVLTEYIPETRDIDAAEASKILAQYITTVVEKGLNAVIDHGGDLSSQITLTNRLVNTITEETEETVFESLKVATTGKQLLALMDSQNSSFAVNQKAKLTRPTTSIAQSSLFTGAIHEPQMFSELKKEIISASTIDMLVSFVKWSGLRLIIDELTKFTQNGGRLRIITTTYMGATDVKAIEEFRKLPNTTIKVSYDTDRTRLHAKTYIFYRDTGFSTAYVGSSNLSNAAISSGLEWNTKVTASDLPDVMQKIKASFESYWNSSEFELYEEKDQIRLGNALKQQRYFEDNHENSYAFDIAPYAYQKEILDKLQAEREVRGYFKNLVVAATGTGKTVISAFDYKYFCMNNPKSPCRLLFIAHREEILKQSLHTFRGILKDPNFGELFVGSHKPDNINHLFISIQTFNSQEFTQKTTTDFYDYMVVDEFHHAAAPTYQALLQYYTPQILLGLTATPERMDGGDILSYFNHRIAAEIRLPEAIDRKLLAPFQYFGVTDVADLESLKWSRGGYDKVALSNLYTMSGAVATRRADMVVTSVQKYVTDLNEVKGLGFCVSIDHAEFMAEHFNSLGIPSLSLTGKSAEEDRNSAKIRLVKGEIRFIFVVDIYNEGVDIPEINTVLFLRPTESLTVFMQQLGRGLRLSEGKDCLTVLDFIGQAHKKYNFEDKFSALLSHSTKNMQREIKEGFLSVPKGCYIQLEKKAKDYILKNISSSFGAKAGLIARIATFTEDSGLELTLSHFLNYYHLDIRTLYQRGSFSRLCVIAGVFDDFKEDLEEIFTKALLRFSSIDSRRFILFLKTVLTQEKTVFSPEEERMLFMFHYTVWQKPLEECGFTTSFDGISLLQKNPTIKAEFLALLDYNYNKIDFIDQEVDLGFPCPLDLHCTYTRDQLLVAMDFMKPSTVREGVKYLPDKKTDIFFVTLNKSDKEYSPTTMYHDYSINEILFHWQSQSTTSETSNTGMRYQTHREKQQQILIFVREYKNDKITATASPYTFLGKGNYMSHEGSRPMNITWKLEKAIPAKFLKKTNKMVIN